LSALDDEEVRNAIQSHFDNNEILLRVRALGTFFPTGHDHICFDFAYSDKIRLYNESVVVIVNDDSKVIGFEDHFKTDIVTKVLSRPKGSIAKEQDSVGRENQGDLPFILDRPSEAGRVLDPAQVSMRSDRSRGYFQRIGISPTANPTSPFQSLRSGTSFETSESSDAWTDNRMRHDIVWDNTWDPVEDDPWDPRWILEG